MTAPERSGREEPVTAVGLALRRRRRWFLPLTLALLLVILVGLAAILLGLCALWRYSGESTPHYAEEPEHFKYGSIGSEPANGLPRLVWDALPGLFPEAFPDGDYASFGFLYEEDGEGGRRALPIGIAERKVRGIDLLWLNCAVCHAGTWRPEANAPRRIVLGMPANNFDLGRFIGFLLEVATDERFTAEAVLADARRRGESPGWMDRLVFRLVVFPLVRDELLQRRARLGPLLAAQPAWGPGRVDTFNPYKLLQFDWRFDDLNEAERVGAADLPSIWLQGPRGEREMQLHWDGNNASLAERNLSAAVGAGVTPETVDHRAIERVAAWLRDLPAPASPLRPAGPLRDTERGRALYREHCAACHGDRAEAGDGGYDFEAERLGAVTPLAEIGTDPARLDSYTEAFSLRQRELFAEEERYRFRHFTKTDGYANHPLDGLWLRAPYLHNGSVPTLEALLRPPAERPATFLRGGDVLDRTAGGFRSGSCAAGQPLPPGLFCFDTSLPGNGREGHLYGTGLPPADRQALLNYLKTF